jgi:hypothetical protein
MRLETIKDTTMVFVSQLLYAKQLIYMSEIVPHMAPIRKTV